jgi:hypothetical protein
VVTDGLGLTCFSFSFLCDRYRSHDAVSSWSWSLPLQAV